MIEKFVFRMSIYVTVMVDMWDTLCGIKFRQFVRKPQRSDDPFLSYLSFHQVHCLALGPNLFESI